ncbi:hypothetical protein V1264_019532 [Littorina saxatilis]|uniref:EF-hand domain-containing protein n=2 Tax=Littorina saxatilis TaxID=31220 RepID=A0AAN9BG35_9CAEN
MSGEATTASLHPDGDKGGGEGEGDRRINEETSAQTQEHRNGENIQGLNTTPHEEESGGFTIHVFIPYWLCCCLAVLPILIGVFIVLLAMIVRVPQADVEGWMHEVEERVGQPGIDVFQSYDLNRDGYMSIYEFEPLIPHLKNLSILLDQMMPMETFLDYSPKEGEEVLVLHADFTPLQLDTMTNKDIAKMDFGAFMAKFLRLYLRFVKYTLMPIVTGKNTLFGLRNWTEANRKHEVFGASEFLSLLPDDLESLQVGETYSILEVDEPGLFGTQVHSSSRYLPPKPKGKEQVLYRLLGMMHPHPFVQMRFPPRGTIACVQALSDRYVHIVFRMHAEFQLNNPPVRPFWFTPAQFLGDLVMSRDGSHVHYFHMRVPSERRLNVDMEWIMEGGEGGMEVDIGYMPQMEWMMDAESHLPLPEEEDQSLKPDFPSPQTPAEMQWSSEAPRLECLRMIEKAFYPFKQVTYHNLTEAFKLSKKEDKPMHAVFLWGALDDQSC